MKTDATPDGNAPAPVGSGRSSETFAPPEGPATAAKGPLPLLQGPKRQHFLPRFYLEGFAREGLVAVYDREKGEVRLQQSEVADDGRDRFQCSPPWSFRYPRQTCEILCAADALQVFN